MKPGHLNAITDVPGVKVGHYTLIEGPENPNGPAFRTGITSVLPPGNNLYKEKITAACHVINGFGKTVGLPQIMELGLIETPILLTSTLNVWRVADGLVDYVIQHNSEAGSINPVVGECNDAGLNDSQKRSLGRDEVFKVIESASTGPVDEGSIGAGTGMTSYGWKAGVGTASRLLHDKVGPYTLGALVVANHGQPELFSINNIPVGQLLREYREKTGEQPEKEKGGSIMIVLATDAPCPLRMLQRMCRRAVHGLARCGTYSAHGSGDFVFAFTTYRPEHSDEPRKVLRQELDHTRTACGSLFQATVEAVEEAVINAIISGETMAGTGGRGSPGIPRNKLQELAKHQGKLWKL